MKLLVISILIFLSLSSLTSAFTYINIYIDESGEAIFLGESDVQVNLPEGVRLEQNGQILGRTQALTTKSNDVWTFSYTLQGAELNIILPERARILNISNPSAEISLDGDRISVFTTSSIRIGYTVTPENEIVSNFPILLIFLAILAVAIVYLVNFSKREKRTSEEKEKRRKEKLKAEKEKLELIKQVLNDREKAILDKLKETGKIKTSQLRKMLGIPKASFSRHLQEMEKKGLIKRDGEGKNKFVELS